MTTIPTTSAAGSTDDTAPGTASPGARRAVEGWESTSLEQSIVRSLRRIIRAVGLYSRELLRRRNLTTSQLATLRQLGRYGPLPAGHLARGIAVSQATITGVVDRLEERGLVTRSRDPRDRRRVVVDLTEQGLRVVASSPPPLHERFMLRLAELPPAERLEIDRMLGRIVEMMEVEEVEAAPVLAAETVLDGPPDEGVDL